MLDIDKGISLKVHCPPKKQTEIIETNQKIRFEFAADFLETNKKKCWPCSKLIQFIGFLSYPVGSFFEGRGTFNDMSFERII